MINDTDPGFDEDLHPADAADAVADAVDAAYKEGVRHGQRLRAANEEVRRAEDAIDDQSWRHEDPTGQDADVPVMDELYTNLIQARDKRLLVVDPDRYSEQKYFEACSRHLP